MDAVLGLACGNLQVMVKQNDNLEKMCLVKPF